MSWGIKSPSGFCRLYDGSFHQTLFNMTTQDRAFNLFSMADNGNDVLDVLEALFLDEQQGWEDVTDTKQA